MKSNTYFGNNEDSPYVNTYIDITESASKSPYEVLATRQLTQHIYDSLSEDNARNKGTHGDSEKTCLDSANKQTRCIGRKICILVAVIAVVVSVHVAVALPVYFLVFAVTDSAALEDITPDTVPFGRTTTATKQSTSSSASTVTASVSSADITTDAVPFGRTTTATKQSTSSSSSTVTASVSSTAIIADAVPFGHTTTATKQSTSSSPSTVTASVSSTGWSSWGTWTTCSVSCGSGVHTRYRQCRKLDSLGADCVGDYVQQAVCSMVECPVHGKWTLWSPWDTCDVTCGGGVQSRSRTCLKSSSNHIECVGYPTHQQSCAEWHCPDCSRTCMLGTLNDACDACVCESTTVTGRLLSATGNPIGGALLYAESAPTKILAESNSTGFFILTETCVPSSVLVSRPGFQDKVVDISTTFQVIKMELEVLPQITEQPKSKFRLTGEDVIFCCSAKGSPKITYYEWFHESVLLNKSLYGNNGTLLKLSDVKPRDSGQYTCRANSPLRAIMSVPATLTVKEYENDFCQDALQQKKLSLPDECVQPETNTATIEVGECISRGCRPHNASDTEACKEQSPSCCVPSRLEIKTLNCTGYEMQVIVVKECGCWLCDTSSVEVFGKAMGAKSDTPLVYGEVWLNGDFMSYTDARGSFYVSLSNSVDKAVFTIKDTYTGKFLDTTKIIDFTEGLSGSISVTFHMLQAAPPVHIDSKFETTLSLNHYRNVSDIDTPQITIPANSFYRTDGSKFSGNVSCRLTFLNSVDIADENIVPGKFQFVDDEGLVTNLASKGVFNVRFEDENKLPLIVGDVTDVSFPESSNVNSNFTLWTLNEATGLWEQMFYKTNPTHRKRRRTEKLIDEIKFDSIPTWINIDEPYRFDNLCYFKIRVYRNEKLEEEIIQTSQLIMEYHRWENDGTLVTYLQDTRFPSQQCFSVECNDKIGYIRLFYSQYTIVDSQDLNVTKPLLTNSQLEYSIQDNNKTFKCRISSNENGPFFKDKAVCEASSASESHIRFHNKLTPDTITVQEFLPSTLSPSLQQEVMKLIWYPKRDGRYKTCYIKIKIVNDYTNATTNITRPDLKFRIYSQGGQTEGIINKVLGFRTLVVSASSYTSSECIEYKCSGLLEGSKESDHTLVVVTLIEPSLFRCHVTSVSNNLRNLTSVNQVQLNANFMYDGSQTTFIAYAPADRYGESLGVYQESAETKNGIKAAKDACYGLCMKNNKNFNAGTAVTFHCHD